MIDTGVLVIAREESAPGRHPTRRIRADIDVRAKAAEIVAFMSGIQTQWPLDPKRIDLVGAYRGYVRALERELRRKPLREGSNEERTAGTSAGRPAGA